MERLLYANAMKAKWIIGGFVGTSFLLQNTVWKKHLIYNDVFSKSMNVFGSSWQVTEARNTILNHKSLMLNPSQHANTSDYHGTPYPFGLDPVWQISTNKIVFLNSFKMKVSIIIGVLHMTFGVLCSLWNNKYFGKVVNILHEFLPQVGLAG